MKEQAVAFGGDRSQIGVLCDPPAELRDDRKPGFLILNSGVLHHVGPNRGSVSVARKLAEQGFRSLRFDFTGIGDSPSVQATDRPPERFVRETQEAMNFLGAARNVTRFVLLGNCSGAGISFLTVAKDPRVSGAVLINPQGPGGLRYLFRLARNRTSWARLFRGLLRTGSAREAAPEQSTDAKLAFRASGAALTNMLESGRELLYVFCEWDPGLDAMKQHLPEQVAQLKQRDCIHVIPGMNHDFDLCAGQDDLQRIVLNWAKRWDLSEPADG